MRHGKHGGQWDPVGNSLVKSTPVESAVRNLAGVLLTKKTCPHHRLALN
jgi:hypothetical protein